MAGLRLLTETETAPLSVADLREHLALTGMAHDSLLESAIADAVDQLQRNTGRRLTTTTYRLSLDDWPDDDEIRLPQPPCQSVESVKYIDSDGVEQTLVADTDYWVDVEGLYGRITPVSSWPTAKSRPNAVKVEFTAGYDADDRPLPTELIRGLKLLAAHLFLNRSAESDVVIATVPMTVREIVDAFKANW